MSQYCPSLCYIQQSSDIQDSTMSVSKGKSDISPALYSIRSVIFESLYTCVTLELASNNVASLILTCCPSSVESWRSASCFGWGSPPWQWPRLWSSQNYPRCFAYSVTLPRFTSASPPSSQSQCRSTTPHCLSWQACYPFNQPASHLLVSALLRLYTPSMQEY